MERERSEKREDKTLAADLRIIDHFNKLYQTYKSEKHREYSGCSDSERHSDSSRPILSR